MGKHRLLPHLIVEGGLDAIDFYERAFGAEKTALKMAQAVEAGATLSMRAEDTFWGARYGGVRDPFGHVWSFHALHKKKDSDEH